MDGCNSLLTTSPWTFALYRGHMKVAELLAVPCTDMSDSPLALQPITPGHVLFGPQDPPKTIESIELELDELPSLSLPPPIIPFRIYGHKYLDQQDYVQISFSAFKSPVTLFNGQHLASLKMVISNLSDPGLPFTLFLVILLY